SFDIGKDGRLRLLSGLKPSPINQLGFQTRKEALHHRIVPTIPRPTHGTLQTVPREPLLIPLRCILATAIRVMQHTCSTLSRCTAIVSAVCVRSVVIRAPIAQPTTPSAYKSNSTATARHSHGV